MPDTCGDIGTVCRREGTSDTVLIYKDVEKQRDEGGHPTKEFAGARTSGTSRPLHIRRPVHPGTYEGVTMCFLQNLKQKGWASSNPNVL